MAEQLPATAFEQALAEVRRALRRRERPSPLPRKPPVSLGATTSVCQPWRQRGGTDYKAAS